ncbi:MAG: hypothetical protein WDN47_01485 [Candidatus Doudnabacteria bacterium]
MEMPRGKILTFSKCSCCNDCYFFFIDNSRAIAVVPVYSKAGASYLLETCKLEKAISSSDYQFFCREISDSRLPERIEAIAEHQKERHLRKPDVLNSYYQITMLLFTELHGEQPSQRSTN